MIDVLMCLGLFFITMYVLELIGNAIDLFINR